MSPLFGAQPVIVIHLGTDDSEDGRTLAACCGERFYPDNGTEFQNIPRVLCPGCAKASKGT